MSAFRTTDDRPFHAAGKGAHAAYAQTRLRIHVLVHSPSCWPTRLGGDFWARGGQRRLTTELRLGRASAAPGNTGARRVETGSRSW
jgi:hypothetical protein